MVLSLLLLGCAGWPRAAHLEAETGLLPGGTDPREQVVVSLDELDEVEPNDTTAREVVDLSVDGVDTGAVFTGTLRGAGWSSVDSSGLTSADCPGTTGAYVPPSQAGDYAEDLDFYLVDLQEDGTLCARLETEEGARLGVDLLLIQLDDTCSLPVALVEDEGGTPLGFAQTSPVAEWSTVLQAPQRLAVLVAGYGVRSEDGLSAVHSTDSFPYRLGLSVVPSRGGQPGACPLL